MKKLKLFALTVVALMGVTGVANADAMLAQDDFVGISFWVISMGMKRVLLILDIMIIRLLILRIKNLMLFLYV